jgi:hypothetical protein
MEKAGEGWEKIEQLLAALHQSHQSSSATFNQVLSQIGAPRRARGYFGAADRLRNAEIL